MTIEVHGPDGISIQFPDGMTADQIGAVMRQHFGGPQQQSEQPALPAPPEGYSASGQPVSRDVAAESSFLGGALGIGPALESGAEHAAAWLRSKTTGEDAGQLYDAMRKRAEASKEAYPITSKASGIAGTVTSVAPLVRAFPAAFGAGAGPLTVSKVAIGTGTGGVLGGIDAAARSGGDLGEIAVGTGAGALGGAAGPLIGTAASRVGRAIADRVAQTGALDGLGVSRPAADIITRAAESDGALNGQGLANIQAAGPGGMLADAGPAVQNVLDTAIQRGGPSAAAARQAVEGRAAAAGQNIDAALDQTLGRPQGIQTATTDLRTSSAPARQQAYDTAYNTPIDYSSTEGQALEDMVRNRVPANVIARANNQMRLDGDVSRQIMARVADDGTVTYERMPDVRQLDYITRALNDVSRAGDGQGALGGYTAEGRSYGNLSRDIRDTLRQAVPEYGAALDTAAQPINARNALDFGAQLLRPTVPRDVAAETIGQMTNAERQLARQGVRSQISEALANVKRTVTDPNIDARQALDAVKQFSSDAAQEKIGLLLPAAERRTLQIALDQASRSLELRASIATNSRTAARLMTNKAIEDATQPGIVGKLAQGEPVHAAKSAVQFVTGMRPSDITRRQDEIYGELARVLTGRRGADATDFLRRITGAYNRRAAISSFASRIPYTGIAQTGLLSLTPPLNERTR
jgi:hypothetical protein